MGSDLTTTNQNDRVRSPLKIVVIVVAVIFVSEFFIMGLIRMLALPPLATMLIDSALLIIVLTPTIYTMIYKPLTAYAREQQESKRAIETSHHRLVTVLDSLDAIVYVADLKTNELLFLNKAGQDIFGDVTGEPCWRVLQANQQGPCDFCAVLKTAKGEASHTEPCLWQVRNTVNQRWYDMRSRSIQWVDGRAARLEIATDCTARKNADEERERLIGELETALNQVKILSGIVPICTFCKEIRDDKGYWNQLESFISEHSDAQFSHSVCPKCMARMHPGEPEENDEFV
jgi:hypothetical protein